MELKMPEPPPKSDRVGMNGVPTQGHAYDRDLYLCEKNQDSCLG